ncbi:YtxH domain-containing protein [Paradesertivirga mongoliensis]|uniref:YtxH domain-containing protein n=1 Tax=Paradesertivirga mongoliensis TaxID=2100740 RepID=A0ABW4ZLW9_9SPHI|nr:YtxH domain-containing protein [Pedobacter mongoliensis]
MSLLKYLVFGAAVAAGVNYATKKREDGKSLIDDLTEKAPEWMDKAKQYTDQFKSQFGQGGSSTASTNQANNVQTENPPY